MATTSRGAPFQSIFIFPSMSDGQIAFGRINSQPRSEGEKRKLNRPHLLAGGVPVRELHGVGVVGLGAGRHFPQKFPLAPELFIPPLNGSVLFPPSIAGNNALASLCAARNGCFTTAIASGRGEGKRGKNMEKE